MVVRLLMIVAAAVVLLSSGFSCYTHGKTDQDVDMDTKVRRDTLQSLANASALLSNLRDFPPPLLTPSSIICCPALCCRRSPALLQVRIYTGETVVLNRFMCRFVAQVVGWGLVALMHV